MISDFVQSVGVVELTMESTKPQSSAVNAYQKLDRD
jgi:hypothetical protein